MKKLFILIFVLGFFGACSDNKKTIVGQIDGDSIDIGSKVPGRVISIFVKEGDMVKKGQVLAKLDGKEIRAKLRTASAGLSAARQQYAFAEKTFNRIAEIYEQGVIARQNYDEAYHSRNAAGQRVAALRGQYAEVASYVRELTIKAPIDGEITQIAAKEGELASQGFPIFTILKNNEFWVVFNIREDDLKDIKLGNSYQLYLPSLDKTFEFEVYYIAPMGNFASWKPTADTGNYDLKTFETRMRSKEKIEGLRPAMTVVLESSNDGGSKKKNLFDL
ncbi:MAG: efflux RND transporter periplasmic adaptor subunit [Elusimicrobiota bacterium]|nr:efflux RND transporter periplasmic adaptor subunit [Elusimicrobiota bacterium]